MHPHHFDHETLECYRLLAGVARWYLGASFPRGAAKLKTQGVDAAQSAALNVGILWRCRAQLPTTASCQV